MILISITDLFIKNVNFSKNQKNYFEISDKDSEIQKDVDDAFEIDVSPLDFQKNFKKYCLEQVKLMSD